MISSSFLIERIDGLSAELQDLESQLREIDQREEIIPLLNLMAKQSLTLKEIYNEFCRLEESCIVEERL